MTDKTRFRPVLGTDAQIQNTGKNPGWVYFASDTGKIFFDIDPETRVAMGGSGVSLLYGEAPVIEPDEQSFYTLLFEHLEEDITPKEGDLILNQDGIFYRVQEVNSEEETILCSLMSVSGSGGGSSTGPSYAKKIGVKITPPDTSSLINNQALGIKFVATSGIDTDGSVMDDRLQVKWELKAKTGTSYVRYDEGMIDVESGKESIFELGEKLRPDTTSRLEMTAIGVESGESTTKYIEVITTELKLNQSVNFSALKRYLPDEVNLECNAIGSMNKILKYYFDDQLIQTVKLNASAENTQTYKVPAQYCTHGSHKVRIELWQAVVISGVWSDGIMVDPIEFEIGVFEANSLEPVIWLGEYQESYYNYDPIKIPFLVYDPANTGSATITLKKNGIEIASSPRTIDTSSLEKWNYFEITDADLDMVNRYSIGCNEIERDISFMVAKDPNRNMEFVKSDYLKLSFDSKGRSNNESIVNRQIWETADGKVKAEFKDFNWYNNGWVLDEDNNTCLRISNGAQFSIPYGKMTFASTDGSKQSNSIEIQFKIRNVQDYSNLIHNVTRYVGDDKFYEAFKAQTQYNNYDAFLQYYLPIYDLKGEDESKRVTYDSLAFDKVQKEISLNRVVCGYYSGDETNAIGFALGPQDAFFSNGTNTVNVNYVENKMVNISMVYSHNSGNLMYIYINGVLTGVIRSTLGDAFTIDSDKIVFNSQYCDIDLYKIRIYNTDLNVNDIVTNYAVDYRDITIYDQNKLAEENSSIKEYQFKYKNMVDYNEKHPDAPIMPYIIFDTTPTNNGNKLSYSKKTKLNIGVEFINTGLDRAFQSGELEELAKKDGLWNDDSTDEERIEAVKTYYLHHCPSWKTDAGVEMAVQGTSSEFYPRRNYKLKTKTEYITDTNPTGEKQVNMFLHKGPFETDFTKHGCKASTKEKKDENGEIVTPKYSNPCHTKNWYMDNYTNGTDRWTMKVDFMESSGSYNTGFANLVANAYSKHPLKDYIDANAISNSHLLNSEVTGILDWSDYRTSVQGFPVLAFHKRGKDDYLFIGMYRMNLDKGSDACYGFEVNEEITANFVGDGKKPLAEVAECWEFCNNNRGFCSFRDPWDRMELSFKAPAGEPNEFNATQAPWIMDNVEYRYNVNEDAWDLLLKMSEANNEDIQKIIVKEYGQEYSFDPASGNYEGGRKLAYKFYENWEAVNKWVWSTNTDKVPSQGTYELVNVGNVNYTSGKFYIFDEESGEYLRADGDYEFNQIYYNQIENKTENSDGEIVIEYTYSNAFAVGPELKYEANKFYREENGAYSLISDTLFDSSMDYYMLVENDSYKSKTHLIVRPCNDVSFNPDKTYYNYDGSQTDPANCVSVAEDVYRDNYLPGKYYEAVEVTYGNKTYTHETKEYRAAKFVNELKDWFDLEYLATYFIMTEVFECYDSRGKNAMWASWGPLKAGGNYKWYPIFYDIDTQLGINNTGIPSFDYNVDATEAGNYSTSDSVLWNNFYKYFKSSYILMKYKHLKGVTDGVSWPQLNHAPLYSIDRIEGWYQTNPDVVGSIAMRGERPLIATNLDEYFKYITITNSSKYADGTTGYIGSDSAGSYTYDANGTYFYALQGDRSLSRQQFLTNRIEYIDSWLNQGNYQRGGANRIRGRVAANNAEKTSDIWVETVESPYYDNSGKKTNLFDAEYWLNLTPIRSSYVTVSDDAEAYPSRKYDGVNPVKFNIDAIEAGVRKSANYPEQLLYVYGLNQMTDLGDMSNLYWQEFEISGDASKLTTLKIGYDGLMETKETKEELIALGYPKEKITEKDGKCYIGWYNNKVNQPSIPAGKNASGMPLLKEVNFSNVTINTGSPSLDLSSCEKLQNFRATGSNFIDLRFAEGAAMHTCYLPSTITRLDLTECNLLTNLITNYEAPVADAHGNLIANRGLYIQGMFEEEGSTVINYFSILGGGLGYDSYKLLKKYYDIRSRQTANPSKIALTKVNWSPYVQLVEGDVYDSTAEYYLDDGHYGFKAYTYNAGTFKTQVLNGEIYRLDKTISTDTVNQISDIDMFNAFMTDNLYVGTNEGSDCPNITGIMYVANETPIDEYEIRTKLATKFPQLTVFFKNVAQVNSARFILQEDDGTWSYVPNDDKNNLQPSVQKVKDGEWFENPYKLYKPVKDAYDFLGWSTTPDASGLISSNDATAAEQKAAWEALSLESGKKDYTFYAIFTVHKWRISFKAGATENSLTEWYITDVTHGELLETPSIIPSIPEDSLDAEERYRFLGWTQNVKQLIVNSESEAKLANIENMLSTQNMEFYGVFLKESVYASATSTEYFTFVANADYTDPYTGQTYFGYRLQPKVTLSGKVTLPTTYNNQPVISIAGFRSCQITHVFWDGECQVVEIAQQAFNGVRTLKYFDMAKSIKFIGRDGFAGCTSLEIPNLAKSSVNHIDRSAFNGAFKAPAPVVLNLPGGLQYLGDSAFSFNTDIGSPREAVYTMVNIGGVGDPSRLTHVGKDVFAQNSSQRISTINVFGDISPDVKAQIEALRSTMASGATINYASA